MSPLVLALVLAQVASPPALLVRDEGLQKGRASTVNCTGAGVTCSTSSGVWTLNVAGGGGPGATLPTTTSLLAGDGAGGAVAYAGGSCAYAIKSLTGAGVPACLAAPTIPTSGVSTALQKGDGAGGFTPYAGATCTYAIQTLDAAGAATACRAAPTIPTDTSAASFVTTASEATLSNERVLAAGSGTTVNTGTAGQVKIDVTTPVASASTAATASALAADPADCVGAGEFSKGITAAGVASGCAVPTGTYVLPGASSVTAGGVLVPASACDPTTGKALWNGTAFVCGTDQTGGGGGAPTGASYLTMAADATLSAEVVVPTCTGTDKLTSNGTAISCATDQTGAGGGAPTTAQYWVGAADGALSAEKDLSGFTGLVLNTAGVPSAAAASDLPAHLLMGPQHSDVDTAATTAGDIVVRNAANTQWGHQAIGGANTVLHGGATAPTWSAVDLSADTAATLLPFLKGGTGGNSTPTGGGIAFGNGGLQISYSAAGTAGQVLRSAGTSAPVWVGVQTCTSSAATTCTITVARSGCTPVCGMGASAAGSTWVRAAVATTTLTCTFSTSGTNICNCLCP